MVNGKYSDKISALVLLAPATSPGSEQLLVKDYEKKLKQVRKLVSEGKGNTFLDRNAYGGIMPKSADSYIDFSYLNPEFEYALPFHKKRLPALGKIKTPILSVIGDQEEYTVLPITDALSLIKKENTNAKTVQISNCDHDFQEKEEELAEILIGFFSENNLCSH